MEYPHEMEGQGSDFVLACGELELGELSWEPGFSGSLKKGVSPFPHLILDQAIPSHVLHQIDAHWPGTDKFVPEVPGNFIFW